MVSKNKHHKKLTNFKVYFCFVTFFILFTLLFTIHDHHMIFRATGFLTMKVGKTVAVIAGGSIILLQIAANEGYIQIDWNKITKKANKIADKAEEAITGEGPSWAEKVRI